MKRYLLAWVPMIGLAIANGAFREAWLVPRLGGQQGRQRHRRGVLRRAAVGALGGIGVTGHVTRRCVTRRPVLRLAGRRHLVAALSVLGGLALGAPQRLAEAVVGVLVAVTPQGCAAVTVEVLVPVAARRGPAGAVAEVGERGRPSPP